MSTHQASTSTEQPGVDPRPPLSCYIRTMNEAERLGPVIAAAARIAREIVVIDSGSTDTTVAIAEAAGARVIHNPWPGNGFQKRVGEEACTYDWLLDLDADEVVSDELVAAINALFAGGEPANPVYAVTLLTKPPDDPLWTKAWRATRNKLYDRRRLRIPAHAEWDQLRLPEGIRATPLAGHIVHHQFRSIDHLARKGLGRSASRARHVKPRPLWQLKARIIFAYPFYFLKFFLQKGLWRAGVYGYAISGINAYTFWLRDVRMYEAARRRKEPPA